MKRYLYSVANDTANGVADLGALDFEIRGFSPPLSETLIGVSRGGDVLFADFPNALPAPEEATLDGIIGAHTGAAIPFPSVIQSAQIASTFAVSGDPWADIGGVVTTPAYFGPVAELFSRVTLAAVTSGEVRLRVVERDEAGTDRPLVAAGFWALDTSGATEFGSFDTDVAALGPSREFVLQASGPAGATGTIRSASISLLRLG